jgi:hypothetical protein
LDLIDTLFDFALFVGLHFRPLPWAGARWY